MAFTKEDLMAALQGQPAKGSQLKAGVKSVGHVAASTGRVVLDTLPVTRRTFKKEMSVAHERSAINNIAIQHNNDLIVEVVRQLQAKGIINLDAEQAVIDWEEVSAEAHAFMEQAVQPQPAISSDFLSGLKGAVGGFFEKREKGKQALQSIAEMLVVEEPVESSAPKKEKPASGDMRFGFDA